MRKIILASKSPRRRSILNQVGLKFKIDVSQIDERKIYHKSPTQLVKAISKAKANVVSKRHKNAIIIGADTIVVFNKEIIGKPSSRQNAKDILKKLSGEKHTVITGFTILDTSTKKEITKAVKSLVKFKKMSQEEINEYVKTGEPMDKAGGYGIQDKGAVFIEYVVGDYFNVVGLPIFHLAKVLKEFDVDISSVW